MQRRTSRAVTIAAFIATAFRTSPAVAQTMPQGVSDPGVQAHIPPLAWILAAYLLVLAIISVYLVFRLWPSSEQLKNDAELVRIIASPVSVRRETHILLIVLAMGLVGGCAYDLWNLADN